MFGPCYRDENCETSILCGAIPCKPVSEVGSTEREGRERENEAVMPPSRLMTDAPKAYRTRLIGLLYLFYYTIVAGISFSRIDT